MIPTLVRTELRRLTSTRLGVLAFAALMCVPLLYGGVYLWGNLDPYGSFSKVPAGVVVLDRGTTDGGAHVNRGRTAADAVVRDGSFDWHEMSAATARRELADGGVDFVLTFPADFSADLASTGTASPTRAGLDLATNDANSYLSSTIAKSVTGEVRDTIARQVGTAAAKRFLVALSDIRGDLGDAADGAGTLSDGASSAASGAQRLASGAASLSSGAASLASGAGSTAAGAQRLASGASSAASGASSLAAGTRRVASGADSLADGLGTLSSRTGALGSGARQVRSGAAQVADGNAALAAALHDAASSTATGTALAQRLAADGLSPAQIQGALAVLQPSRAALSQAASKADALASGARSVQTGAGRLASGAAAASSAVRRAASGARSVADGAARTATGARSLATADRRIASGAKTLASGTQRVAAGAASARSGSASLATGTAKVARGADSLHDSLAKGVSAIPATTAAQRTAQADAIGDPVAVRTTNAAGAGSYGAGLAPLFLSLSAWIGSYALFLILRPLSRRAVTAVRQPLRIALAGWLTPALLGAVQMIALLLIAVGPLGIRIADPVATLGVLLLTAGTFASILLLLNAALGSVGQFLGLVLMLVQLVTAGGTFPWQTLPGPLAAVHHALPMSYAVDALRQVMYGGDAMLALGDAAVLATWLVVALLLTAAVAARQTRHRTLRDLQPSLIGG